MRTPLRIALATTPLLVVPGVAAAQTLSAWVGLLFIMAGLMLTAAILFYGGGMVLWAVRLNTFPTNRDYAIELLQWGIAVLFVLILMLAIVQFTQNNTRTVLIIIAVLLVFFIGRAVARSGGSGGGEKEVGH